MRYARLNKSGTEHPAREGCVSIYQLPPDLPAPVDDGATDHLVGAEMPQLVLESSQGPVDLAELMARRAVLYIYPATGIPGRPTPDGWDAIPGARGCTPQSCAFRHHAGSSRSSARGSRVFPHSRSLHRSSSLSASTCPFPLSLIPS